MKSLASRLLTTAALLAALSPPALFAGPLAVRGTVLDAAGAPLAGARAEDLLQVPSSYEQGRLRLAGAEPAALATTTTTDALGRYALTAPGPGVFTVRLGAAGAVPLQSPPLPLVEDAELPPATPPPDVGAALVVRDGRGGGRAGAYVLADAAGAARPGGWRIAPRVGRVGADGALVLPRVAGEALTVRVFGAAGAEAVHTGWTGGPIVLDPQPAAARRLRVRDRTGAPVPDVLVRAGEALWPVGLTGADGGLDVVARGPEALRRPPSDGRRPAAAGVARPRRRADRARRSHAPRRPPDRSRDEAAARGRAPLVRRRSRLLPAKRRRRPLPLAGDRGDGALRSRPGRRGGSRGASNRRPRRSRHPSLRPGARARRDAHRTGGGCDGTRHRGGLDRRRAPSRRRAARGRRHERSRWRLHDRPPAPGRDLLPARQQARLHAGAGRAP